MNADVRATLKLLDLAEDFLRISSFCRGLHAMQIEMALHGAGMESLFDYMGSCHSPKIRVIDDKGLKLLFRKFSLESSMRLRPNVSDEFYEMRWSCFEKSCDWG